METQQLIVRTTHACGDETASGIAELKNLLNVISSNQEMYHAIASSQKGSPQHAIAEPMICISDRFGETFLSLHWVDSFETLMKGVENRWLHMIQDEKQAEEHKDFILRNSWKFKRKRFYILVNTPGMEWPTEFVHATPDYWGNYGKGLYDMTGGRSRASKWEEVFQPGKTARGCLR